MTSQARAKQERIIEAVRRGLEGDAAIEFVCQSGYAMNTASIARHLRSLGGRGHIEQLISEGKSNIEILQLCFPEEDIVRLPAAPPTQFELFEEEARPMTPLGEPEDSPLYETVKLTVHLPADLYEALRMAARAENRTRNEIIVDILTSALSQMPERPRNGEE